MFHRSLTLNRCFIAGTLRAFKYGTSLVGRFKAVRDFCRARCRKNAGYLDHSAALPLSRQPFRRAASALINT
jgi:hypothetical protein